MAPYVTIRRSRSCELPNLKLLCTCNPRNRLDCHGKNPGHVKRLNSLIEVYERMERFLWGRTDACAFWTEQEWHGLRRRVGWTRYPRQQQDQPRCTTFEMSMSHEKNRRNNGIKHNRKHFILKQLQNLWIDKQNVLKSTAIIYQSTTCVTILWLFC
jgi:hypothetical protein